MFVTFTVLLDHIALPSKGGAMENWGLITYGESSLCVNQNKSAVTGKMNTVAIVAHELAHQVDSIFLASNCYFKQISKNIRIYFVQKR